MSVHGGFGNSFERFGSVFERLSMIFVTLVEVVGVFKDFLLRLMTFKDILGTFVHGFGVFVCGGARGQARFWNISGGLLKLWECFR